MVKALRNGRSARLMPANRSTGSENGVRANIQVGGPDKDIQTDAEVRHDKAAAELMAKRPWSDDVMTDKGYDSENLRHQIEEQGLQTVILGKENSNIGHDSMDYKYRHQVENVFAGLKHFGAIVRR